MYIIVIIISSIFFAGRTLKLYFSSFSPPPGHPPLVWSNAKKWPKTAQLLLVPKSHQPICCFFSGEYPGLVDGCNHLHTDRV